MVISVPLMGHTSQLIALSEKLASRGHTVSIAIHPMHESLKSLLQFVSLHPIISRQHGEPKTDLAGWRNFVGLFG
jgi:UDP:flavonoid glycosyltransferase YjiC (YdhE family)